MHDALILAAALVANVAGLGWLALAMDVHWAQVRGSLPQTPAMVRSLRLLGGLALASSLALCLAVDHASMAALVWVMSLAGAALVITFVLAWRARWLGVLIGWARVIR